MKGCVCVLAWWFAAGGAIGGGYVGGPVALVPVGPFRDQAQCEQYRRELDAWKPYAFHTTSCWWDGKP